MKHLSYESALESVRAAVREINDFRAEGDALSLDEDAVLFGDGSALDSVGLVQVVMAAEAQLADATGVELVLASEAAMSRKRSPYRSLRNLAEYAVEMAGADATV
ncbi:MAG: hypothetical protein QNJ20_00090 [Paracoccaceae bacterium]|nr:hypothetical protein [Paracoccaceae bacterium]